MPSLFTTLLEPMHFTVSSASNDDIPLLTAIQWAALGTNPLIRTLYPKGATPGLAHFTNNSYKKALGYPSVRLIKATHDETGVIVGYAKWIMYNKDQEQTLRKPKVKNLGDFKVRHEGEDFAWPEPPVGNSNESTERCASGWEKEEDQSSQPPDSDPRALQAWGNIITRTRSNVSGPKGHACKFETPCSLECYFSSFAENLWVLDILHTHPSYQNKGAGMGLVKWGTDLADKEGLQCYVEASPAGYQLCQKFGFKDVAEMTIKLGKFRKGYKDYKHTVMIRPPFGAFHHPEAPLPISPILEEEDPFADGEVESPVEEPISPLMTEAKFLNLRHPSDRGNATLRDVYENTPSTSPKSSNV